MQHNTIGPVILDVLSTELSAIEREMLQHPLVAGVILFSRNYDHPAQVKELCRQIRSTRAQPLLIAVDHEGGRVQRFRQGFTALPPMGELGECYVKSPEKALALATHCGTTLAQELLAVGIDLSFAPVLDLNKGLNTVIGDRAFHRETDVVVPLAKALITGMHQAGMAAVGKHFPGHGSVNIDSHIAMPIDERDFDTIALDDLVPFVELIVFGVDALMPAHILFPAVDTKPVGFSSKWLKTILREALQFKGVIFSDDLNMEGAGFAGDYPNRAIAALHAGCDFVLICNNPKGAEAILDQVPQHYSVEFAKFQRLQRRVR